MYLGLIDGQRSEEVNCLRQFVFHLNHLEIHEVVTVCVNTEILTLVVGMKWVLSKKKIYIRENDKMEINIKQRTSLILFIVVL